MNSDDLRRLSQDVSRISGVTIRLCQPDFTTLSLSGDDAVIPNFRNLPSLATTVERAITSQGDFLLLALFSQAQLRGYIIAGPCQVASSSLANTLCSAFNGQPLTQIHDDHVKVPALNIDIAATENENDRQITQRYLAQNRLARAVSQGNREQALTAINQIAIHHTGDILLSRIPNRQLRSTKNVLYAVNTSCRIAAEHGHLTPVVLDQISSHYALIIENLTTTKPFQTIMKKIATTYCQVVATQRDNQYSPKVNLVIQFIARHYQIDFSLATLAKITHLNADYLSRSFKQETGESIFSFLNRYRIQRAQQQLLEHPISILDVAFQVGYSNATHFNRMFKRYVGMTPSDYLRERQTSKLH